MVEQLTESMKKSSTNTAPNGRIPEITELEREGGEHTQQTEQRALDFTLEETCPTFPTLPSAGLY